MYVAEQKYNNYLKKQNFRILNGTIVREYKNKIKNNNRNIVEKIKTAEDLRKLLFNI